MPTYEYRCPNGHDFEHFYRKISEATSEMACPVCGAIAVRRVSGGAGLVFKGSGFYLTDYGKNAHRKGGGESSSSGEAGGDSKSSATSDGGKADSGAPSSAGTSSTPKAESAKTETKPPSKPKGGDAK